MVNTHRLRLLRSLADLKSITAVGASEGLTRSAVSQQLALLEHESGVSLLDRSGRSVGLTDAGRRLVEVSAPLFLELDHVGQHLAAQRAGVAGELRVSAFSSVAIRIVPDLVRRMTAANPALIVHVLENERRESLAALVSNRADLAVIDSTIRPTADLPVRTLPLLGDRLQVLVPHGHALAASTRVALSDLATQEWVWSASAAEYANRLWLACEAEGFTPRVVAECAQIETLIAFVADGLGVAVLPGIAASAAGDAVVLRDLVEPIGREMHLAIPQDRGAHPATESFIEGFRAVAGEAHVPGGLIALGGPQR